MPQNGEAIAATTLAEEGRKQFLPDGAQVELSTGYQNVALESILYIAEIARWTGNAAELPPDYFAPLEKAYEWQMDIVAPDMYLPKINDSWPAYLPHSARRHSLLPERPGVSMVCQQRRERERRLHLRLSFWTAPGLLQCGPVGILTRTIFCFASDRLGWGTSIRTHSAWTCGLMAAS